MKNCNRCGVSKELGEFERILKDRIIESATCKSCREIDNIYRKNLKQGILTERVKFKIRRQEALLRGNFICVQCDKELPTSDFAENANSTREFGLNSSCKLCTYNLQRFSRARIKFSITNEELIELYNSQNGGCAICQKKLNIVSSKNKKEKTACIDHNHETGKIRGLLCHHCNRGIGLLQDNPEILKSALDYLVLYKSGELRESPIKDNPEPSLSNDVKVDEKVQRIVSEESTNNLTTSARQSLSTIDDIC